MLLDFFIVHGVPLLKAVALSLLAAALFALYPIGLVAAAFIWGKDTRYPHTGHPNVVFVDLVSWNTEALYVSPSAIRAMQELVNSPLSRKRPRPVGWENRRGFPFVSAEVCFFYRFGSPRSARMNIYEMPRGVFVTLSHQATCMSRRLFVGGKRADIYRRLFAPFIARNDASGFARFRF